MLIAAKIWFWIMVLGLIVTILEDKEKDYKEQLEKKWTFEMYLSKSYKVAFISIMQLTFIWFLIWGQ